MNLVPRFEAAARSTAELHCLLWEAKRAFTSAACGSQERLVALESIRNIEHELASRPPRF